MAALQFYLSRKQVGNKAEVYVRFYAGKMNVRAKTGIYVPVSLWDATQGRCLISRRYNTPDNECARKAQAKLDTLAADIMNAYATGKVYDNWLNDVIHPPITERPLYDYIDDYCTARDVAPATAAKMHVLRNILVDFGRANGDMYISTLNKRTLESFALYLKNARAYAGNSINSRLRILRTLVYWIGKPVPNPFDAYTIPPAVYGTPIYLTREERDYLAMFPDLSPKKAIQRDIFIFQCHTGCRVADLLRLTPRNIKGNWLVYIPRKTARDRPDTIEVPLSGAALAIIDKYKGVDMRGRLLPFISAQQYNIAIADIAKRAALDRPIMVLNPHTHETEPRPLYEVITSHTARKTFIQIAYAATGDKRLVASMSGHSENSQAFNRYSEITRDMKLSAIEKT